LPAAGQTGMIAGMHTWTVNDEEAGLDLLQFLQKRVPAAPPAYLRQLLRSGKVLREGFPLTAASHLQAGDRVTLPDSRRLAELSRCPPPLEILCETGHLLVVYKPAGLAVHRGLGHEEDNLTERVKQLIRKRREPFMVAPVHRLDAETSGPVIFGKGAKSVAELGRMFMARQVGKIYIALVAGSPGGEGALTSPVSAKGRIKESTALFRTLASGGGYSLLELQLQTGRTHQIRRQLADAGHPLAGDRRYRGPTPVELGRLFLHCSRLTLADPFDGTPIDISSALPAELLAPLEALGITPPDAVKDTAIRPPRHR